MSVMGVCRLSVSLLLFALPRVLLGGALAESATQWHDPNGAPYHPRQVTAGPETITSFLEDAGLTGQFVFFVDFDRDGNAWIATGGGLWFFDGYTWTRFSTDDGLPSNFVRCLLLAHDGTLWIGTNKGVATLDKQGQIAIVKEAELAGRTVRRIIQDPDGTLWFCSDTWQLPEAQGGLTSLRDGTWTTYSTDDGLPSDYVSDYFRDSEGRQFVLTKHGLAQRSGDRWVRPLEEEAFEGHDECFWAIAESPSAGVVTATTNAFYVLKGGRWSRFENTVPELRCPELASTSDGKLITMAGDGSKRFLALEGTSFTPLFQPFPLRGEPVYVVEAPDGAIWTVGHDMLIRWARDKGEWAEYAGLSEPQLADREGRVWFRAGENLVRLEGEDNWRSFPYSVGSFALGRDRDVLGLSAQRVIRFGHDRITTYGPEQTGVHRISQPITDASGSLWIRGKDEQSRNVLSVFDGSTWTPQTLAGLENATLYSGAAHGPNGVALVVFDEPFGRSRLYHCDTDKVVEIPIPDVTTWRPPKLHADHTGALWLHGHIGLFVLVDGSWQRVEGIPGGSVRSAANGDHDTWFAYDGFSGGGSGLGCFRDGTWSYFPADPTNRIGGQSADGAVFFAGANLLYRNDPTFGGGPLQVTIPGGGRIHHAVSLPSGDLWVGVGDKVLRRRSDGVPPQTLIVDTEHDTREGHAQFIDIRAMERFKLRGAGTFTYSWRLDEGAWTHFESAREGRLAINARAGRHVLEVRARDESFDVDPTPARAEFEVRTVSLAERPWFWPVTGTLGVALAFLTGAAVVARRQARIRAFHLERIVDRRTSALKQVNQTLREEAIERRRVEEVARASEDRYRRLVEHSPDLIAIHTSDTIVFINQAGATLLGASDPDEIVGKPVLGFVAPEDHERVAERVEHALTHNESLSPEEVTLIALDGTRVLAEAGPIPFKYKGELVVQVVARDITQRKIAEESLRESEARFRAIADYTYGWEGWYGPDGKVLWVNPGVERITGYAPQECLEMSDFPMRLIHEDDRHDLSVDFERAVIERSSGSDRTFRIRCKDGTIRWGDVSWQPIFDADGTCLGHRSSVRDVTDREKVTAELGIAKEAAESASRAKSVFLANLSHEVRTPMMALLAAAEMSDETLACGSRRLDHRDIILRNGRHLLSLFDNLLSTARLDSGKFDTHCVECSLLEILTDVRSITEPLHCNGKVAYGFRCDGPIPSRIHTDPVRLREALVNLIANALKFTDIGRVSVTVSADRSADEPRLRITVEDSGCGISDKDLVRIFTMFEQVMKPGRAGYGGVGLGLPLTRWIASQLGGEVDVQSLEGHGSVFTLHVATGPIDDVDWITPGDISTTVTSPNVAGTHPRERRLQGALLLADDYRDARELMAYTLENSGATVTAVENGLEALDAASKQTYDLILMDIRMPVMDGIAAAKELRRRHCLAPIIALTASVDRSDRQRFFESGFDDVWAKPISLEELVERVSAFVESPAGDTAKPAPLDPKPAFKGANAARYASFVAEFVEGLPTRFQAIENAVKSGDLQTARQVLHQLAGTGGTMGFMPLSREAAATLRDIRTGTTSDVAKILRRLDRMIKDITHS